MVSRDSSTIVRCLFVTLLATYISVLILHVAGRAGWIPPLTESGLQLVFAAAVMVSLGWCIAVSSLASTEKITLIASTSLIFLPVFLASSADVAAWDTAPLIGTYGVGHVVFFRVILGLSACGFITSCLTLMHAVEAARTRLVRVQQVAGRDARMSALGQTASGIAHDLNNTLTPVVTYTQLLNDERLDDEQKTWVEAISQAALGATQVVKNLQLLYRQDDRQPQLESIEVRELCRQVALLTRPKWKDFPERIGHHIDFQVEVAPRLPAIRGILTEIRQVLINLIFNAAEALPRGGRIVLKAYSRDKSLIIEVCDTGSGMDANHVVHCFEPFYTNKKEGSSLGLSACESVVARHNGTISVESEPGVGTVVRIELPTPAQNSDTTAPVARPNGNVQVAGTRLLYVDDDRAVRAAMVALCESLGIEIEAVEDAPTALDKVDAEPLRAVITDLAMPGMDGIQLTEAIKKSCPTMPVIVVSGWTKVDVLSRFGGQYAPDDVIEKPVTIDALQSALGNLRSN